MSVRYRQRKDRREAWYRFTANMWAWIREAERGYEVPARPMPEDYGKLPVLHIDQLMKERDMATTPKPEDNKPTPAHPANPPRDTPPVTAPKK